MPAPPPGHSWKAVIHNQYVSWLAGWKDSINTKDWKCVSSCRCPGFHSSHCLRAVRRYVQLGATSTIKGESDQRKYEKVRARRLTRAQKRLTCRCAKARELKKHIDSIRADYKKMMKSKDTSEARIRLKALRCPLLTCFLPQAQLAVTTYLVDKLALRAGGEKDEDLADTVGVCTLRVSFGATDLASPSHTCLCAGRPRAAHPAANAEV